MKSFAFARLVFWDLPSRLLSAEVPCATVLAVLADKPPKQKIRETFSLGLYFFSAQLTFALLSLGFSPPGTPGFAISLLPGRTTLQGDPTLALAALPRICQRLGS